MASIIHVLILIGSVLIFWQKTHSKAISLKSSREFLGLLLPLKLGTIRFFLSDYRKTTSLHYCVEKVSKAFCQIWSTEDQVFILYSIKTGGFFSI